MQDKIDHAIRGELKRYFRNIKGKTAEPIYDMVLSRAEKAMLEVILKQTKGNQSHAAKMLGINRNTLRLKMQLHGFLIEKGIPSLAKAD